MRLEIYDTTLRDGTQSPDVNLTVSDKLELVEALDEFGVDYIELGWPGINSKEMETFIKANKLKLKNSKIVAFGSTKRKNLEAKDDSNLKAIIESKVEVACIFGKSWDDHVTKQLKISLEENLKAITESVKFLVDNKIKVFFDAEHFFDGYKSNSFYSLRTLKAAFNGGAECLVLCDTNGGTILREIEIIIQDVKNYLKNQNISVQLGIHIHNDSGLATANTVFSTEFGVSHIQGTINGFGERSGNADLCQVIPNLMLKKGFQTNIKLKQLKKISELTYTLSNNKPVSNQPYVGSNAFAHKGGIHVDAISKGASYEHIDPSLVGNKRNIILSDLSGKANIVEMLKSFGIKDVDKNDKRVLQLLKKIESLEKKGYDIGDVDAEKYLLYKEFFDKTEPITIKSWEVKSKFNKEEKSECKIVGIVHGEEKEAKAEVTGGPVEAAYGALKQFISSNHENVINVKLSNYKVRIAEEKEESSTVRVYIKFVDEKGNEWATVGVNKNILQASFEAIEKGFRYYLMRDE